MLQILETSDQEKYEMYNLLQKDVLIGMLIEANKHLARIKPKIIFPNLEEKKCRFYMAGKDTSAKCSNCGKNQWEHNL